MIFIDTDIFVIDKLFQDDSCSISSSMDLGSPLLNPRITKPLLNAQSLRDSLRNLSCSLFQTQLTSP